MACRDGEPCLIDNLAWLDEAREDNEDIEFLDISALSNEITSIVVDNESREKRQRSIVLLPWTKGKDPLLMMWMRLGMISI